MAEEKPDAAQRNGGDKPGTDWTVEIVQRIDGVVGTVRDKTTVPVVKIARAIVYGLILAVAGIATLFLIVIATIRIAIAYLPFDPHSRRVWVTYAGLGAIFVLLGAFFWRKRKPVDV